MKKLLFIVPFFVIFIFVSFVFAGCYESGFRSGYASRNAIIAFIEKTNELASTDENAEFFIVQLDDMSRHVNHDLVSKINEKLPEENKIVIPSGTAYEMKACTEKYQKHLFLAILKINPENDYRWNRRTECLSGSQLATKASNTRGVMRAKPNKNATCLAGKRSYTVAEIPQAELARLLRDILNKVAMIKK